ncbi:class II aldolase/adducin family protein [Agromyces seonyuensis]|uniref:Class II aldolase/adducin family protein n=1 Tax=Agromyces seonyuensis TaxID=2662446 RepID=A0A6I4P676_9MICO|nr:class II aldolase/adducin family protein [Agromyces seonyuensis]MWB99067.1 class II aldolase/adducin family protein [Agromyces seonyuensis]
MTSTQVTAIRRSVASAAKTLASHGLVIGRSGNVSLRSGELVGLTATGVPLNAIKQEQVTVVDLFGNVVDGDWEPTSEAALHLGILRTSPADGVYAVAHTHSPFASALSMVLDELPVAHYQQLALGGALRVAPFATFGSPQLGHAVNTALEGRLAALMANHGAVALGHDLPTAVEHALLVEQLCELYWRASALGEPRLLDAAQQRGVIEAAEEIHYGAPKRIARP